MTRILHIDASPDLHRSSSRRLSRELVDALVAARGGTVARRDLALDPPPLLSPGMLAAGFTPPHERTPEQREALRPSEEAIDEVMDADVIVLGTPMHHFAPPASVKAWVDLIVRPNTRILGSGPNGPEPRAGGREVYLVVSAGRDYEGTGLDHLAPALRDQLALVGLTDVTVLHHVDPDRGGPAARRSLEAVRARIAAVAAPVAVD